MKIYALPSHATKERYSGVDFARIIQPIEQLNGYKDVTTQVYDPNIEELHNAPEDWMGVMKENDIFYFNYLNNPWGFAALKVIANKEHVPVVMDIDDDIWDIHSDNVARKVYYKGSRELNNFTIICNEVDYITVTNRYLKNVVLNHTLKRPDKVVVLPNYVDLDLYKYRLPFKDTTQIQLTHFGSTTHFDDLQEEEFFKGVDRIMKEYPNVVFESVGALITKYKNKWGQRYITTYGHQDIYHWIQDPDKFPYLMEKTDIMVVPLMDDVYNRCKSSIKWIEASSAKKPGVWQDIRQYSEVIDDGRNGFLAKTADQWYTAIKKLIDDPALRKKMGEESFNDVQKDWTIQGHREDYYQFFKKVLDNHEK